MTNQAMQAMQDDELLYDPDQDEITTGNVTADKSEGEESETVTQEATDKPDTETEELEETANQATKTVTFQRFQQKVLEANELNQKNRELELELARLQGVASVDRQPKNEEPNKVPEINIKQLRREYYEAMTVGDDDKALDIQEKIDAYTDKLNEEKALKIAQRVISEREDAKQKEHEKTVQLENQQHASAFLEKHDYLNDEAANFDPDAFEVFSAFFKSAMTEGNKSFKESLDYAVGKVEALTNRQSAQSVQKKPVLSKDQIEAQLKRADNATPQISKKGTTGNDIQVDPTDMSEEEYEKFRDGGGKFDFES